MRLVISIPHRVVKLVEIACHIQETFNTKQKTRDINKLINWSISNILYQRRNEYSSYFSCILKLVYY